MHIFTNHYGNSTEMKRTNILQINVKMNQTNKDVDQIILDALSVPSA